MNKAIKIVFFVFSCFFIIVISTLMYFLVFKAKYYENHNLNKRVFEVRNKVIRGSILDRNGDYIAYSERSGDSQKRNYVEGEAFIHPVGYFDEIYGLSGIESFFDPYLRGSKGVLNKVITFFKGKENARGSSISLTLDSNLQKFAYEVLGDTKGSIVVMNPKTGEIYALVSKPSFDPNQIRSVWTDVVNDKSAPLYNRAINGKYPPGSIFKIITTAAVLENIQNVEHRKFLDNGSIYFNENEKLSNQYDKVHGEIYLKDAFVKSSNVVFGNLSMDIKNSLLKLYAEKFYFNKKIDIYGLDLSKSYFPNLLDNEKGLIAQTGIGQGSILSTPLHMALVSSVIANDGILVNPYILNEIKDAYGNIQKKSRIKTLDRVIDKQTTNKIKSYMKEVVNSNLSHIKYLVDADVSGKTGTADHKINGIDATPHSWFIGFSPYSNPDLSVCVMVEEGGDGSGIASSIAGEIFNKARSILN